MKNKIGAIFIISALALAGIGITYAGWTDTITITGSINTGSVDWDIIEYSGTWVYKISEHGKEIINDQYLPEQHPYEPSPTQGTPIGGYDGHPWVAAAWAEPGSEEDTVQVTYKNIYPSTTFSADIIIEYKGTIPARINSINPVDPWPDTDDETAIDQYTYLDVGVYQKDDDGDYGWLDISQDALLGLQLHQGDKIHIIMNILLPQDNTLMNLDGSFEYEVEIIQWDEFDDQQQQGPNIEVIEGEPDNYEEAYGVRYKSFGNTGDREFYLGVGDLGVGANRVETDLNWQTTHLVTMTYDSANDKLVGTIDIGDDGTVEKTLEYTNLASEVSSKTATTINDVDALKILVLCRDSGCTINLNEVYLNGELIGSFTGGSSWPQWVVTGIDFTQDYTITGKLVLSGSFGSSSELSKVQINAIDLL